MVVRVAIYGVGSIGQAIVRALVKRKGYEIVSAIDIDPSKVGKDVGEVSGIEPIGVTISSDVDELYVSAPDVVVHATASYLDKVYDQIVHAILARAHVVSTCETLSYPWYRYPVLARRLNRLAQTMSVAIIGTGINPGFLLDTLVAVLTTPLQEFKSVKAIRSLDASKRRIPFQKKIGVGMDPKELKKEFGKDICFHGSIDIQRTLPFGTPDEIKRTVSSRIKILGKGGGFILAPSHNLQPDIPIENIIAMYEAKREYS